MTNQNNYSDGNTGEVVERWLTRAACGGVIIFSLVNVAAVFYEPLNAVALDPDHLQTANIFEFIVRYTAVVSLAGGAILYRRWIKEHTSLSLAVLFFVLSIVPINIESIDRYAPFLFPEQGCPHHSSDYFWYVFDNVLKGALLDLLESYHLNAFACVPANTIAVGTLSFAIRCLVSYGILVVALRLWLSMKAGAARSK